jgi:hypothetical protein
MDYQKIYNALVEKRKNQLVEGYGEVHHIVPRCVGGLDIGENLVRLTAREHFIAHVLLVKIYPNHLGLIQAANLLAGRKSNKKINSRIYEAIKQQLSCNRKGTRHSESTRKKISDTQKGRVGRVPSNEERLKKSKNKLDFYQTEAGERIKMDLSNRYQGRKLSDEVKTKMSESRRKYLERVRSDARQ